MIPHRINAIESDSLAISYLPTEEKSFGYVAHLVDPSTNSVMNITIPGAHPLDPGFVVRQVVPDGNGGFSILTMGWGTGSSPWLNSNEWMASPLWESNTNKIGDSVRRVMP